MAARVSIDAQADGLLWRCRVAVDDGGTHTVHAVTVTTADLERWGGGATRPDVEELVRRSFGFLLERERASSILKSFELAVIPRYFPEYEAMFRR